MSAPDYTDTKVIVQSPVVTDGRGARTRGSPMARVITITDTDTDIRAEIEIGHGADGAQTVRRIVVNAEGNSGLPDDLVNAMIPHIGLPAVRTGRLAGSPNGKPDPGDPHTGRPAPVPAFVPPASKAARPLAAVPAPFRDAEPEKEQPAPSLAPPFVPSPPPKGWQVGKRYKHRPAPPDEELKRALAYYPSRSRMAEAYGVPSSIANNWVYQMTRRRDSR